MTDLRNLSLKDYVIVILSLLLTLSTLYLLPDSQLISLEDSSSLRAVIHAKYNYYFHLTSLGLLASSKLGINVLILAGMLGLTIALASLGFIATFSFAISAVIFATITAIFGSDFTVLGPISLIPWLYLSMSSTNSSITSGTALLLALILTSWLLLYSLAIPTLLISFLIFSIIDSQKNNNVTSSIVIVSILGLILLSLSAPPLPWPDYPAQARVTTLIRHSQWMPRPLIGNDLQFPTLDRAILVSGYQNLLLPLAIIIIITGILCLKNVIAKKFWFISALVLSCVYFDFKLSESTAQILPIQSLPRLIPELNLIPLSPLILSLTITALLLIFSIARLKNSVGIISLICLSFTCLVFYPKELSSLEGHDLSKKWTHSPSRLVTHYFSADVLKMASSKRKVYRPTPKALNITSSRKDPIDVKSLLDRDPKTRWSNDAGKQSGNEWIMFNFTNTQKLIGIDLKTGDYQTDFPRGLKILAGIDCSPSSLREIVFYPDWQGSVAFSPKGYPYFTPQSEVRIFFPQEITLGCLKVEQTAKTGNFDWSISEFRVIKKDKT